MMYNRINVNCCRNHIPICMGCFFTLQWLSKSLGKILQSGSEEEVESLRKLFSLQVVDGKLIGWIIVRWSRVGWIPAGADSGGAQARSNQ